MSLFERSGFEWLETFFVFFNEANRPTVASVEETLKNLGKQMEIEPIQADSVGRVEAVTVLSPSDFAGMDLVFMSGDDVTDALPGLVDELRSNAITDDEKELVKTISECNARLDILHFEEHSYTVDPEGTDSNPMDPGGLLIVLKRMAELCQGTVVDPQTSSVM